MNAPSSQYRSCDNAITKDRAVQYCYLPEGHIGRCESKPLPVVVVEVDRQHPVCARKHKYSDATCGLPAGHTTDLHMNGTHSPRWMDKDCEPR